MTTGTGNGRYCPRSENDQEVLERRLVLRLCPREADLIRRQDPGCNSYPWSGQWSLHLGGIPIGFNRLSSNDIA